METFTIYTLLLTDDKYYVGKTKLDPEERLQQHLTDKNSVWTSKYTPLKVINTFKSNDSFAEDKKTKEMMMDEGIENVRGGSYCAVELPDWQVKALEHEFASINDQCYKCKSKGHFSRNCEKYHKELEQKTNEYYLNSLKPQIIKNISPTPPEYKGFEIDGIIHEIKQVDNYILKIKKLNDKIKQTNINTNLDEVNRVTRVAPSDLFGIKIITKEQISDIIIWFDSCIKHKVPDKKLREIFNSDDMDIDYRSLICIQSLKNRRVIDIPINTWKNYKSQFIRRIDENIDARLEIGKILKESFFSKPIINKIYTNKDYNYDKLLERLYFIKELLLQKKIEIFYTD
jgi:predicted GIY-YIG superfamily endonuclease